MRDIRNMALASLAAFALLIPSVDIDAQVRRTTTTTNQQRTGTGSTQQRSTTTRSTSGTQQRQTGTTTQRSTQQRSNTGSTQNRSTTTRSSSGTQQRQTGTTTQRQTGTVQRQSSSSTQRQTGTTVQRRPAIPIRTVRELLPRGSHLRAPSVRMASMHRDSPAAVLHRPARPVLPCSDSQVLQTHSSARQERQLQGSQVLRLSVRALRQVRSVWIMLPSAITIIITAMTMSRGMNVSQALQVQ